ncbi:reverse transcriptase zinc-binding domain-containing protein [Tanacetum coccineum]
MIRGDQWRCLVELQNMSVLNSIPDPKLSNGVKDKFPWYTNDGKSVNYSTNKAWRDWRNTSDKVSWHDFVWFSNCTPKHSFIMWMAVQGRLTTQDRLLKWYPNKQVKFLFCGICHDSLNHLFFKCTYANEVWCNLKRLSNLNSMPDKWGDIVNIMTVKKHNKSIRSLLLRFILASCLYSIWTERNRGLFTNDKHDYKEMVVNVIHYIGLKLASLTVKRTDQVEDIRMK